MENRSETWVRHGNAWQCVAKSMAKHEIGVVLRCTIIPLALEAIAKLTCDQRRGANHYYFCIFFFRNFCFLNFLLHWSQDKLGDSWSHCIGILLCGVEGCQREMDVVWRSSIVVPLKLMRFSPQPGLCDSAAFGTSLAAKLNTSRHSACSSSPEQPRVRYLTCSEARLRLPYHKPRVAAILWPL